MGCEEIRDLLALYAGGETYDHERATVEAHLGACASCARELDLYREARANLAALRDEPLPHGTGRALWESVRTELFPGKPVRRVSWRETCVRFAAALLLGAAIGVTAQFAIGTSPSFSAPDSYASSELPAPRPVVTFGSPPAPDSWRFELLPRPEPAADPEPRPYLPRVEAIPIHGEKDF